MTAKIFRNSFFVGLLVLLAAGIRIWLHSKVGKRSMKN